MCTYTHNCSTRDITTYICIYVDVYACIYEAQFQRRVQKVITQDHPYTLQPGGGDEQ